jgi:hypothetical protein
MSHLCILASTVQTQDPPLLDLHARGRAEEVDVMCAGSACSAKNHKERQVSLCMADAHAQREALGTRYG